MKDVIRVPAIAIEQNAGTTLYSFGIDGKILGQVCSVSRIKRNSSEIEGYQRPEIQSHISEIKRYLESDHSMLPNSVVIAFDPRVEFVASASKGAQNQPSQSIAGELLIPFDDQTPEHERPGFIVDGQQRLAAIREASLDRFPVFATAFITSSIAQQTEQFILVNSTRPLSRSLVYELLPHATGNLPSFLKKRQFPTVLVEKLNTSPDSPLFRLVKTPTVGEGVIKDTSLIAMIEHSLSDGALYWHRGENRATPDIETMYSILTQYWSAVRDSFPEAWGLLPRKSRLMHGAGIVSMGFIMDAMVDKWQSKLDAKVFLDELAALKPYCKWTSGFWNLGPGQQRKWNEIQNTGKDIQLLANYLLARYRGIQIKGDVEGRELF